MGNISGQDELVTKKDLADFYKFLLPYLGGGNSSSSDPVDSSITTVSGYTPLGTIISYYGEIAPRFYLACDGSEYNKSDYPELANHLLSLTNHSQYEVSGDDTKFKVPDLRGEFLRGTGTNSHENQGSGAAVGVHQDATIHGGIATASTAQVRGPLIVPSNTDYSVDEDGVYASGESWTGISLKYTSRPTNTSVLYCIAYQNIHISLDDNRPVQAAIDRWLRFDPTNKKGLIIKAGTSILKSNKQYKTFSRDTKIDFSSTITGSDNGKDFFVYLLDDDSVIASNSKLSTGVEIGRFHTLCADAGANLTMTLPASPSSGFSVGDRIQVKPYRMEMDFDFYVFYNKTITNISAGTPYDVITCEHPLKGYVAGDILPESVFCKTFYPETLVDDAMVYDVTTDIAVDVYLQSGTGYNTRSAYNATHTVSRQSVNHAADFMAVGKRMLFDNEFTSIARGSNECTNITGSSDKGTVGGHVDTSNKRMISAIGCEECCGYLWQWLNDLTGWTTDSWGTRDGRGSFGQEYRDPLVLFAGGNWVDGSRCGSVCRYANAPRSCMTAGIGGRGCKPITKSASAPKNSLVEAGNNYSMEEKIVGTWIDGKPIYQKTIQHPFTGNTSTQNINIPHYISNLDKVVNINAVYFNPENHKNYPITQLTGGGVPGDIAGIYSWSIMFSTIDSDNISITVGSKRKSGELLITLQYTRTTD